MVRHGKSERKNWTKTGKIPIESYINYQGLLNVSKIIKTELINKHHDDQLAGYFGIDKTQELVAKKYYWETFRHNVEVYVRDCDICLASKTV